MARIEIDPSEIGPDFLGWCNYCEQSICGSKNSGQLVNVTLGSAAHPRGGGSKYFKYHSDCFKQFVYEHAIPLVLMDGKRAKNCIADQGSCMTSSCVPEHVEFLYDYAYKDNDVEPCLICNQNVEFFDAVGVMMQTNRSRRSHPCVRQFLVAHKSCIKKARIFKQAFDEDGYEPKFLLPYAEINNGPGVGTPMTIELIRQQQKQRKKSRHTDATKNPEKPSNFTEFQHVLYMLLFGLEKVSETHEELFDTDCREQISLAIIRKFVTRERGFKLPSDFGMFTDKGNAAVGQVIDIFLSNTTKFARRKAFKTASDRLAALQDRGVKIGDNDLNYEDFFGHVPPGQIKGVSDE